MKTTTMTDYLKTDRDTNHIAIASRESEKAVGFPVLGSNRIAWFPKSQLTFVKDNFYLHAEDGWSIPLWLLNRKAAELGVFPWDIGAK